MVQPHPGAQLRLDIQHPLAHRDQLLGPLERYGKHRNSWLGLNQAAICGHRHDRPPRCVTGLHRQRFLSPNRLPIRSA
jgi:hypothetical protein